jgi:hypothetical protein
MIRYVLLRFLRPELDVIQKFRKRESESVATLVKRHGCICNLAKLSVVFEFATFGHFDHFDQIVGVKV